MFKTLTGFITNSNERVMKRLEPQVKEINGLEPEFEKLTDAELRARTDQFKARLSAGEDLEDLLPEAFATVREAAKRTLGQRHFDMQLMGGIVLHQGKIAEMKTGEGKTLVATLPVYLNALTGQGIHVVTVNDYLAKRDTQWMGPIYHLLGLTVGCLQHEASYLYDPTMEADDPGLKDLRPATRRDAYKADVIHGTNNEFGFDYLRDNMVADLPQMVQRELYYAIVDEVDNILIDEARTPLIISGPAQESVDTYHTLARLAPRLMIEDDYTLDEKHRTVSLTQQGIGKMEKWLNLDNLYDPGNIIMAHYIDNALRAHATFTKDREYVVKDGEVVIVDEFTGRLMEGRRYSDGLHQAIEAKEGVKVRRESITYATITLQNYFRLYKKLAGMTGTALTEAEEFWKIYKQDVLAIPTNVPMIRDDQPDLVYKTEDDKFKAVADEIEECHRRGQPTLVGTVDIEKSERLSELLKRRGIPHEVLNAKHHEREATIVAQAGSPGAVTVATNMAGRGTDIVLGGNPASLDITPEQWQADHDKVVSLGGLRIIGTERHEARRIDNQLRGRSGRQGDPGSSRFHVSMGDDLMRRFGGERVQSVMGWAGIGGDVPLESRLVSKVVEGAQSKVEGYNFEMRKHLVEYDDVANAHRDRIYGERKKILSGADLKANVQEMIALELEEMVSAFLSDRHSENWDIETFQADAESIFPLPPELKDPESVEAMERDEVLEALQEHAGTLYQEKEEALGPEAMRDLERAVMLRVIDSHWVQHLTTMENMRQGIGLQAYGQRDPLVMYKKEAFDLFKSLLGHIQRDIVHSIFNMALVPAGQGRNGPRANVPKASVMDKVAGNRQAIPVGAGAAKVGRNDPCPCGSGKKYKRCHGA